MRILIAPDDFKGTMTAAEAAEAIHAGWQRVAPDTDMQIRPLSDGGPGFVQAIAAARDTEVLHATVRQSLGAYVQAAWCIDNGTAFIEVAQSVGLEFGTDILRATSFGVGELVLVARDAGARRIVVGLGGSNVNDAGAGMLAALGATARGVDGAPVSLIDGPLGLGAVATIDLGPAIRACTGIEIVIATDVDVPLLGPRGATYGFAPQKGAFDVQLVALETALQRFASVCGKRADGKDPAVALGAGAAGGLGYAFLQLGGRRVPGIDTVWDESGIDLTGVDLIVTGEGNLDWQSQRGKVVSGVTARGSALGIPVIALCGQVDMARRERMELGLAGAYSMTELVGEEQSMDRPIETLATLAERVARTWR